MRKLLLSSLLAFPILGLCVYAAPVSLTLFSGGLSVLDSLLLIGIGLVLIGILFLCIAFFKSSSKKEELIESPFDVYLEETETDDVEDFEEAATEEPDTMEDASPDTQPEEEPPASKEEPAAEPEAEVQEPEPVPEVEPETELEPEPAEEKIYPKLILTNAKTNDFMILPLYAETTIGRKPDSDLVLPDTTISGLHCKVLNEDGTIYIQDENSTNGTFVNGERIFQKTELHKGDKILLGKQEFNVSINE